MKMLQMSPETQAALERVKGTIAALVAIQVISTNPVG